MMTLSLPRGFLYNNLALFEMPIGSQNESEQARVVKMKTSSKVLVGAGIVALLAGASVLLFTATILRYITQDDLHVLRTQYDPHSDAAAADRTYDRLYGWTQSLMEHRNQWAARFHGTLGVSFLLVGVILMAWAFDHERLRRRMEKSKGQTGG
jgi:hypothetical protein